MEVQEKLKKTEIPYVRAIDSAGSTSGQRQEAGAISERFTFCAVLFLGVVYLAGFFLMHSVKDPWLDEIFTYFQFSGHDFGSLWGSFHSGVNLLPPAYFVVLWIQSWILGDSAFAMRLPSLLCMLAAIFITFKFLRLHFGNKASLVTTFTVFAFAPELLVQQSEARPYSMYFMLAVASAYYTARIAQTLSPGKWLLLANAVFAFLLPFTHYYGGLYSAFLLVALVLADGAEELHRKRLVLDRAEERLGG